MREKSDLIVLQSRSPSCGVKQRYDGTFTGTLTNGAGVTAQLLMENGFRCALWRTYRYGSAGELEGWTL